MSTSTLEGAVARIQELEARLGQVHTALQAKHGYGIDELLEQAHSTPAPTSETAAALHSAGPLIAEGLAEPTEPVNATAVDISPYILKALAIRKGVHAGTIEDGALALRDLLGEAAFTTEQELNLRQWAGMQ